MRRALCWLLSCLLLVLSMPCAAATAWPLYSGDADGDGVLTTMDARAMLVYIAEERPLADPLQADYNGDGTVNTADVRAVLLAVVLEETPSVYVPPYLTAASYSGEPYCVLYDNQPRFTSEEKVLTDAFEQYASRDSLGRCGVAFANLSTALMPDEERESISSVTPSGWHNKSYDFVSGGWVYNRSHMIGFQLAGEQANADNLITGTRYLNTEGMLPFENMVADYIKETEHHVLYRVTPVFIGDDLLAQGVIMEAWSVEDGGEGICFCVFCYNVQPGVVFDYATGDNHAADELPEDDAVVVVTFVLNTQSKKFHLPTCRYATSIKEENRQEYGGNRESLLADGYSPCGTCDP